MWYWVSLKVSMIYWLSESTANIIQAIDHSLIGLNALYFVSVNFASLCSLRKMHPITKWHAVYVKKLKRWVHLDVEEELYLVFVLIFFHTFFIFDCAGECLKKTIRPWNQNTRDPPLKNFKKWMIDFEAQIAVYSRPLLSCDTQAHVGPSTGNSSQKNSIRYKVKMNINQTTRAQHSI